MNQPINNLRRWISGHPTELRNGLIAAALLLVAVQLFFPGNRMLPFARVDGVSVGGQPKSQVIDTLNDQSARQRLAVTFGKMATSADTPLPSDVGMTIGHQAQVEAASYPWWLRVVPTSLFWYGLVQSEDAPSYRFDTTKAERYISAKFGDTCTVPAKDATLKLSGDALTVVPSQPGGSCQPKQAVALLAKARPTLSHPATVTVPVSAIAPRVGDSDAKKLAGQLNARSQHGIRLTAAGKTQTIPGKEVLSWLTFKPSDDGLAYVIDPAKANAYFTKTVTPLVAKPAGVTKVTTVDFTETARQDGQAGQTLALDPTLNEIRAVLEDQKETAIVGVTAQPPKVEYDRSFTKTSTGIAAQLKFYDDDHAGDFGVVFSELGGQGMSAQHNGDRQFVTASTYKLFVAFSTIKRVEDNQMSWNDADISAGRNLSKCFDDMIVKSDNACAEALIQKIGAKGLNADIKSLGLNNTAFRSDNNVTTANDLANYLTQLEKGTMPIKAENRDRLLGAMKRNVYRQGVPAGASGPVADKVGFLWGLLHDATIVYSPKGTYVLVVLTDGSTWANIADLTRKIEALR